MKKFAAHYLFADTLHPLHYVELEDGILKGIFPLQEESAGVLFLDGLLAISRRSLAMSTQECYAWKGKPIHQLFQKIEENPVAITDRDIPVFLYQVKTTPDRSTILSLSFVSE